MHSRKMTESSRSSAFSSDGRQPLVSVGMLAFNDQRYVALAIADILSQSFSDLELIISDDCSEDQTYSICRRFADEDRRVRLFRQQTRLGMQKNYEFVLNQASGKYFMWASSDDRWDQNFVSLLVSAMEEDSNLISVFSPFRFIDETGAPCAGRLGGVHTNRYSSKSAFLRLVHFCLFYSDAFFYGLHRKALVRDLQIPVWRGINADIPANNNYPVLAYLLARGEYRSVGEAPLFLKRVHLHSEPRHSNQFAGRPILAHFAFLVRKVNVFYESILAVRRGSQSLLFSMACVPLLLARCIYDCTVQTCYAVGQRLHSFVKN